MNKPHSPRGRALVPAAAPHVPPPGGVPPELELRLLGLRQEARAEMNEQRQSLMDSVATVDRRVVELRGDMRESVAQLRGDMRESVTQLRGEFRESIAEVRGELREGLTQVRGELREGLAQVRGELREGLTQVRGELREGLTQVRGELKGQGESLKLIQWMNGAMVALMLGAAGIYVKQSVWGSREVAPAKSGALAAQGNEAVVHLTERVATGVDEDV